MHPPEQLAELIGSGAIRCMVANRVIKNTFLEHNPNKKTILTDGNL